MNWSSIWLRTYYLIVLGAGYPSFKGMSFQTPMKASLKQVTAALVIESVAEEAEPEVDE